MAFRGDFSPTAVYFRGDRVAYNGLIFQVNSTVQGVNPVPDDPRFQVWGADNNEYRGIHTLQSKSVGQAQMSGALGLTGPSLPRWRKAKANVIAGLARARIVCVGDSTTAGIGAQDSTGRLAQSWTAIMSAMFTKFGLPNQFNSVMGTGNIGAYATYNPKLTQPAGWGASGSDTIGGPLFVNGSTTNGAVYTPTGNVDTIELYCQKNTGNGILSYQVDAGGATQIDQNAADSISKTTIALGSLGAHTLTLARVSGGIVNFYGLIAYDSTAKAVDIINAGRGSGTTTDLCVQTSSRSPIPALVNLAPDLVVFMMGINDYTPATLVTPAQFAANLLTLYNAWIGTSDMLFVIPPPSAASRQSLDIQETYMGILRGFATANNCGVLDLRERWLNYDTMNGYGYYFDTVHPNQLGYADMGMAISQALLNF